MSPIGSNRHMIPGLRPTMAVPHQSSTLIIVPKSAPSKSKSAQSKPKSKNLMLFSAVQDWKSLQQFVRYKPVVETFEEEGNGSLRRIFDGPAMRECAGYWAACMYVSRSPVNYICSLPPLPHTRAHMGTGCNTSSKLSENPALPRPPPSQEVSSLSLSSFR